MYKIQSEASFDSAHFLKGYSGKCANLHGHRWRIVCEVQAEKLHEEGQLRGMVTDFTDVKVALKKLADHLDHKMVYEAGTLKAATVSALKEEGFDLVELPFRPTAECLAEYFFREMRSQGFQVGWVSVFETPTNSATYCEG